MQAIEFDTVVQAHSIPLPSPVMLAPSLPVRVVPDFVPLSRDEAHER
jgi:hypothetical protein